MKMNMSQTTLVTGGSGFVGCHLVQQILEAGTMVHATVRSLENAGKLRPLRAMQVRYPGQLALFEADLLVPGSFDAAMAGCTTVHHLASPVLPPEMIQDGRSQMLEPALQGTRNVLGAVERTPSVRRVVMTSTVGAIFGTYADVLQMKDRTLSEEYFNSSSTPEDHPYHYAKVEAEKEAWRLCEAQRRWSLVIINPGMILGPSLTPCSESGSLFLLDEMLKGYFIHGMPDLSLTTVDVREVALAHVQAGNNPAASGRYILADLNMVSFVEIAKILRQVHHFPWLLPCLMPSKEIPSSIARLIGPLFGLTPDCLRKHVGIRFEVDNRRSIDELGIVYRPIEETLFDHYRSWAGNRGIRNVRVAERSAA